MTDNDPDNTKEFGDEAKPQNPAEVFGNFTATLCLIFASIAMHAWVVTTMWNWFGVVFIDRPITLVEGTAAAMLLWTTRTMPAPDADKRKAWERFKHSAVMRLMLLATGWIIHAVMFR